MSTRVGYTGGTKDNPTYHNLGDHTESIEIVYDPTKLSYEALLEVFWSSHNPVRPSWSRQYMSAIYYHNDTQKGAAVASRDRRSAETNRELFTEIVPAKTFYQAEDYHQKYGLRRHSGLMKSLAKIFPDEQSFVTSTLAARLNGRVGGHGTLESVKQALAETDVPEANRREILDRIWVRSSKTAG